MNLRKATVVKRNTDDGVSFLRDEVPIGFVYLADLDSISPQLWLDGLTGKVTERDSIMVFGSATSQGELRGFMPLELFKLETEEQ